MMGDVYYEKVTPCPECGSDARLSHIRPKAVSIYAWEDCPGPGGSRVRLEVIEPDNEAAYESMVEWVERRGVPDKYVTRKLVAAAVGGAVLVKETDE